MAKTNTEKPTGKSEIKKSTPARSKENKKIEVVKNKALPQEKKDDTQKEKSGTSEKKEEKKKIGSSKETKKTKKESVKVISNGLPVSPKVGAAICKFIMKKKLKDAIMTLEEVIKMKKAIPMKGEIPHRKGKIMSGRFPVRAAKDFLILLKSLESNANYHDVDEPIVTLAVCNKGETRYGRAGTQKKRSNVLIIASEVKKKKETNKK